MSDDINMGEAMSRYTEMRDKEHKNRDELMRHAISVLRKYKIPCVAGDYSGSGDSGCFEQVYAYPEVIDPTDYWSADKDDKFDEQLSAIPVTEKPSPGQFEKSVYARESDPFRYWLMSLLEEYTPDGYEINEGGQGVIVLDVEAGEVTGEHGSNVVEVNYSTDLLFQEEK